MVNGLFTNRVAERYFITTGAGQSNAGSAGLQYETGSYDAALNDAGIENANIIKYTSVIPTNAIEIPLEQGLKDIQWGQCLECIMAQSNGRHLAFIAAGVIITNVADKNGRHLGGFACEYSGNLDRAAAGKSLLLSIEGMIERRGMGKFMKKIQLYADNVTDKGFIIHPGYKFAYKSLKVEKASGTVFASICFTKYRRAGAPTQKKNTRSSHNTGRKRRTRKKKKS